MRFTTLALGATALAGNNVHFGEALCAPQNLQVEYSSNPVGVDSKVPRFSYQLCSSERDVTQASYHILVSKVSSNGSVGDLVWDSGVTDSSEMTNIVYASSAKPLESDTDYSWTVTVQGMESGKAVSATSEAATFSTGIAYPHDWAGAEWIGANASNPIHTLLRTQFEVPSGAYVERALAYVVGLGYYKLHVDGVQVSTHELGAFTTYEKRVLYDTYNCKEAINSDPSAKIHTLAVELGPGWYAQAKVHVGQPSLLMRLSLSFSDGTSTDLVSSTTDSWETAAGPILESDIYNGETYDSQLELSGWTSGNGFGAGPWVKASPANPPSDDVIVSSHSIMPTIGIRQKFSPCDMWESSPGVYVFDFCQNMAGFTILNVPTGAATGAFKNKSIQVLHAEAVHGPKPAPIYHHYSNTKEVNTYIMNGDGNAIHYVPKFVYAGFRYAQITGYPGTPDFESLKAMFVNTMYEEIGSVSFSDPNLDAVQHITRTAAMSNFQSIPTDCPQRERRGWLGDAQLSSETNTYNFGMAGVYSNFVALIDDAQDPATNATQDCVPWYNHGHQPADPAWGSAYTFLANLVAEHYKDDRIFADHYAGIKGHLDSLRKEASIDNLDGLLTFSWWGDWCPPSGCKASKTHHNSALVSSFEYILQLRMVARYAGILGYSEDAALYTAVAKNVSDAFVNHFFDPKTNTFMEPGHTGEELTVQTCIALASSLKLIPEDAASKVFQNLVDDVMVKNNGHLNVGIVGVKELLPALSDGGRVDVALTVAQTETQPGWVYMVLQGATTLWETWTGSRYQPTASWNHIMFGSQSSWYYKYLAGIRLAEGTRGWESVEYRPHVWAGAANKSVCEQLSNVDASVATIRGPVSASWTCSSLNLCQDALEQDELVLQCPGSATIQSIQFASFGTPTGSCAQKDVAINASCHNNNSKTIVEAACLHKNSCSVLATDVTFKGDPCFDVKKQLLVQAVCGGGAAPVFNYQVMVPAGSNGSVVLPTFGADAGAVQILESGSPVFKNGQFVSGITGINAASVESDATGINVRVSIASGAYNFSVIS